MTKVSFMLISLGAPKIKVTLVRRHSHFHCTPTSFRYARNQLSCAPKASTVYPQDTFTPNLFRDTAPSRPPSRVGPQSIDISERVSSDHPAGDQSDHGNPGATQNASYSEPEDEQLNRAMAISMSESQTLPGQETGTVDYGKPAFGPANQKHYEADKWAMVFPAAQTQEILLNPEPRDRKRQPNTPVFFKTSSKGHRLSALIKILHAIPMAREALLNRTQTLQDYGYEKDWWDGTPVKVLRIVNLDTYERNTNEDDVIYEAQRLMAFLDKSDRAYGSTAVLAESEGSGLQENAKVPNFMSLWQAATVHYASPLADIFESVGTKLDSSNPKDAHSEHVTYLTIRVDNETSGKGLTLYEALDHVMWVDAKEDDEIYLQKVADVFTLEVENQVENVSGLGIEIPPIWYADRYLPSKTQEAKDMLARKAAVVTQLQNEEKLQSGLSTFQKPKGGAPVDAAKVLAKAAEYFERKKAYRGISEERSHEDLNQSQAQIDPVARDLKELTARISDKLKSV